MFATRASAGLACLSLVTTVVPYGTPEPRTAPLYAAERRADVIRSRQWHLSALRAQKSWKWGRGKNVTVAVLDTGVDTRHPDLVGQVITGPDYTGGTRKEGSRFWGDHGTAMASIIAGHGNGSRRSAGILGIAPQAKILSIRVTWENDDPLRRSSSQVSRSRDAVAKGIRYAVDNGADIINMSLGGGRAFYNGDPTDEAAIEYALSKGVIVIAAAGNDGAQQNRKNFPAAYPGVIAVGALDQRLRLWKDSNRRSYVSVCAPGVDIVSAAPGNRYVAGTGTSPSSAIVAGVAALIRSRYPDLTPEEIRQALEQGVAKRSGTRPCSGSVDAVRAVTAAHKINKAGQAAAVPERTPSSAVPATAEEFSDGGDPGALLIGILGGGGALVLVGLVLGWRQRRRPEETDWEPPAPERPREPVGVAATSAALPAWQAAEPSPPAELPSFEAPSPVSMWPPPPVAPSKPTDISPPGLTPASLAAPVHGNGHQPAAEATGDWKADPLGDQPLGADVPLADTPLADETWRDVQRTAEDDIATNTFPAIEEESDEDEFRPPWW